MVDRGPEMLAAATTLLITSWITFLLRVWVRGFVLRTWGTDDWLMACSIGLFTAYNISEAIGVHFGTGRQLVDLEPNNAKTALITWWLCELFYVGTAIFLKLSVGVFLHRVAVNQYHVWIIRVVMLCTAVFGLAYFFVGVFMCQPVNAWWIRKHDMAFREYGSCISDDAVVGLTYAAGSLNSIADFTFGILPFFIIRDLHMPTKSKRLVMSILAFANIACIATIVRMPFVLDLYKTDDWLYATADMVIWCSVEVGIGITAACFATLRPLLRIVFGLQASQWFPEQHPIDERMSKYPSDRQTPSGSSRESYRLKNAVPKLRPDHVGHYTEISSGGSRWSRGRSRERKDTTITERAMCADQEEQDTGSTAPNRPAPTRRKSERAAFPSLEIRKNFEVSHSVTDRTEDEYNNYERPHAKLGTEWYPDPAPRRSNEQNLRSKPSLEGERSDDDTFTLPLQTHGLDR